MWHMLMLIVFAVALVALVFAPNGYINREWTAYLKTLEEPWVPRIVALLYEPAEGDSLEGAA